MSRRYHHLSAEERALTMIELQNGSSLRRIAARLGRSASTLSRELRRCPGETYDASHAGRSYQQRRERSRRKLRLVPGSPLYQHVHDQLVHWRWSPRQIAVRLRTMPESSRPGLVSHETIYAAIYAQPRGGLKQALVQALRQAKPSRGPRRTTAATRSFVPEELRIQHRPEAIEQRLLPGHWEGDLIKGAFNRSAVGVLVERRTRFVILCRMGGCTAADALEGFSRQMKRLPAFLRESLTYDCGSEMACFRELSRRVNIDIWFCDPHAPWQRGSNENTNGLLRQFLPKGADLSLPSQTMLNDIARLMNGRPRMTLDWQTPAEAMAEEIKKFQSHRDSLNKVL